MSRRHYAAKLPDGTSECADCGCPAALDPLSLGVRDAAEALSRKLDWFLDHNIYRAYPFEKEALDLRAILAAKVDAHE